jgi:hypothetical protein
MCLECNKYQITNNIIRVIVNIPNKIAMNKKITL